MARHRLFISHSSRDASIAADIVAALEAAGIKCWISSRDVPPGENYQEEIVRALRASEGVVLLFSAASNRSREVKKELSLASTFGLTVLPLRIAAVEPGEAFLYEFATNQWIDAVHDLEAAKPRLIEAAFKLLEGTILRTVVADAVPVRPETLASDRPVVSAAELERLAAILLPHIGPIASVLVRRTAAGIAELGALHARLSEFIPDAAGRAAFMRACAAEAELRRD